MRKKGFMTIGYGNMNVNDFIERLVKNRVSCIVDIRSRPYSKFNISFNKEELRDRLAERKISYFWYGNKLGGRYDKISLCDERGIVDYEKVAETEKFKDGIKELLNLCDSRNVCIMCSENNPLRCHRFLLVSRVLREYNIYHIMSDGKLVKNSELESKLFDMYGSLNQLSLFDADCTLTFEQRAYKEQGFKTAYISEKVKDMLANGITKDVSEKLKIFCIGANGKTAEEFFNLLKEHNVRRIIDLRPNRESSKSFASYPDIAYYLKLNYVEYERIEKIVPRHWNTFGYEKIRTDMYKQQLSNAGNIFTDISEDMSGTCFLGEAEDFKSCYRYIFIKELKKIYPNITIRHLR